MRFLIVDDEEELREIYKLILAEKYPGDYIEAVSGNSAKEILKEQIVDFIISDYNMPNGNGYLVFQEAQKLEIPFILTTSDCKEDHPEFNKSSLFFYLQKPFEEYELINAVKSLLDEKYQYISIPLHTLLKIKNLRAPMYLKLSSNKMIKVFNSGDQFTEDSFQHWSEKKISSLLVERKDFDLLVSDLKSQIFNELFFNSIKQSPKEAINISQEILEILNVAIKTLNINQDVADLAHKNVNIVLNIIKSHHDLNKLLESFNHRDDHGTIARSCLIALICTFLIHELQINFPKAAELLVMAAFFHDIGINDHLVKNESHFIQGAKINSPINKEQIEKVKNHIKVAVDSLKLLKGVSPDIIKIVEQHHELPNGSGYPLGLKCDQISDWSVYFIVAHQFSEIFFGSENKMNFKLQWTELKSLFNYPRFIIPYNLILSKLN